MSANLPLNPDLLRRYDKPGPRYTSYPTAPHFSPVFGTTEFQRLVGETGEAIPPRPLSLYVHIPFCSSPCLYCGCNRVITRSTQRAAAYVARLLREIEIVAPLFDHREVLQLHFGGGTPNFLTPAQLGEIIECLRKHFGSSSQRDREISIEMDPRFARPEDFEPLAWLGINRVSFGVQDFDSEVQLAVNRVQSCEQTLTAIGACRNAGIASINVDLMYGLPLQSPASFRRTLRTVIDARPSRLAVYGYAHLPALFKAQRRIHSNEREAAIDAGHLPLWRGLELDADDIIRADIISQIMCQGDVDITAIENRYGIDFWTYFSAAREQLATLEADGLVWTCASRIVASNQGRYLLRLIAACFDRYLAVQSTRAPAAVPFSKVM